MLRYLKFKDWAIGLLIALAVGVAAGGAMGVYEVMRPYGQSYERHVREKYKREVDKDLKVDGMANIKRRFWWGFAGGSLFGVSVVGASLRSLAQSRKRGD